MKVLAAMLCVFWLAACANSIPSQTTDDEVAALAQAIIAMSADVDPAEATRAAQISFAHSRSLATQYQITDPPLVHNAKVNAGLRPRGLCYHWAADMEARLSAEGFATLQIARAIANAENRFLIEHSSAVIVAKGAPLHAGIILDPWRKGGTLFWSGVENDPRYKWKPREDALRAKGQIRYAQRSATSLAPLPADLTD
jgi:hypothetical protein